MTWLRLGCATFVRTQGLDGLPSKECGEKIVSRLEGKGRGRLEINYRLRDWIFSRQRYWGEVRVPHDAQAATLHPGARGPPRGEDVGGISCISVYRWCCCDGVGTSSVRGAAGRMKPRANSPQSNPVQACTWHD